MSGRTRERQVFKVVIDFSGHTAGIAECQVTGMFSNLTGQSMSSLARGVECCKVVYDFISRCCQFGTPL